MNETPEDERVLETKDIKKVYEVFPFLTEFPFDDYEISYYEEPDEYESKIDPLILSYCGSKSSSKFINFEYIDSTDDNTHIIISLYLNNVKLIEDNSKSIKRFDRIRETMDKAFLSDDLSEKIEAIKSGMRFVSKISPMLTSNAAFDLLLDKFIEKTNTPVTVLELNRIKRKSKRILEMDLSDDLKELTSIYYNIHINYVKIIIGLVIATRLY